MIPLTEGSLLASLGIIEFLSQKSTQLCKTTLPENKKCIKLMKKNCLNSRSKESARGKISNI